MDAFDKIRLFWEGNSIEKITELEKKAKKKKRKEYDDSILEELK